MWLCRLFTFETRSIHWQWDQVNSLRWRHNGLDGVSNHQPHDCLLNLLLRCRSKKTSKLCVTGLCEGNSPVTDEFPAQMISNAEIVSIWWRHHVQSTIQLSWNHFRIMSHISVVAQDHHWFKWRLMAWLVSSQSSAAISSRGDEFSVKSTRFLLFKCHFFDYLFCDKYM